MAEDFTEEQFDDELPRDAEPAPTPKPLLESKRRRVTPEVTAPTPKERYGAFMMPTRIGVIDNELGKPILEDTEINSLLLGLVTKLLNEVDEIKRSL